MLNYRVSHKIHTWTGSKACHPTKSGSDLD
nr:MAG TPA: hypothetical protein [Caudoviricetes sp.]